LNKNVTIVTGLWDLGRGSLEGWSRRSFETYKEKFFELLDTDAQMAIWIPSELKLEVEKRRVGKPTRIYIKEVKDFETWNPFFKEIQEIRNNSNWRNLAGWLNGSPQADLSHYNAMMFTKMFMVNDTAIFNPFKTDYFFWVDGGLTSTVPSGYFTHDRVLDNLDTYVLNNDGKAVFLTYPYTPHNEVHGFEKEGFAKFCGVNSTDRVARGGFWGGSKEHIHKLNERYYGYLHDSLKNGLMGADENIFTILTYRHSDLIRPFEIEGNGLVWPFFEHLKALNNTHPGAKTGLYVITYNSPAQFETLCKSMESYDPHLINFTEKFLLNNSTDSTTDSEYDKLCTVYNFTQIRKPENIGICGGRQFIAEHFNNQNHLQNYLFFEDDMFFYTGPSVFCRNGFIRKVPNILQTVKGILEKEELDFLKFNFTEFFGDNSLQWAWHNIPPDLRESRFAGHTEKPPTLFSHIKSFNNVPYALGEIFYCNWPQLVSRDGNIKMFLETTWDHPYEQTWMSHIYQETVKGNIKPGLLLATPTEHDRFDHYPKEDRKEN